MFYVRSMLCILVLMVSVVQAVPVAAARKGASEIIEQAAKKSGKALTPAAREASKKALVELTKQYGDDVLNVVAHGGLEALEQGTKHGKLFWQLAAHSDKAARILALHADDLMPLARRIGPDFMKLELRMVGLGRQAVTCFGDDAVKILVKLPPDDAAKLVSFAAKADTPKTAKLLMANYKKTGGKILQHLDGKKILAAGLTTSMVIAAYKVSDGVEDGIREVADGMHDVARNSPEDFTRIVERPLTYVGVLGTLGGLGALALFLVPLAGWLRRRLAAKPQATANSGHAK